MTALENLAGIQFGALTDAELLLLRTVPTPAIAWCGGTGQYKDPDQDPDNDPANVPWPERRSIRAELFGWLCREKSLRGTIDASGIGVGGAWFRGKIDLSNLSLDIPITLNQCWLPDGIDLYYADGPFFDFSGTRMVGLNAQRLVVHGDIWLKRCVVTEGGVELAGARIDGDLDCEDATLHSFSGRALSAEGIRVGGDVILASGFQAIGEANFDSCRVSGQFVCEDGEFNNQGDTALSINGAKVEESLILSGKFRARGMVDLIAIDIGGQLDCEGGHFLNRRGIALSANGAKIRLDVFLNNDFRASGTVDLIGIEIGGELNCSHGRFANRAGKCLTLKGAEVSSSATIGDGSYALGQVDLDEAKFGGDLDCSRSTFSRAGRHAVSAVGATISGIGWFEHNATDGIFDFRRARFGSDLSFTETRFVVCKGKGQPNQRKKENGLDARAAKIGGRFAWKKICSTDATVLKLRDASVGLLDDDELSWLGGGRMILDGFEYGHLAEESPTDCASRKKWLRLQKEPQTPQPYNQLASVYRAAGRDADATGILIAKEEAMLEFGKLSPFQRIWKTFLGRTVRYGYEPLYASRLAGFFVALGMVLFFVGYHCQLITPTEDKAFQSFEVSGRAPDYYEPFNALSYSLETFLPLVDLDQRKSWFPNPNQGHRWYVGSCYVSTGDLLRFYLSIHTMMGWFIAAALGAGIAVAVKAN
jgi:hypothetical protein